MFGELDYQSLEAKEELIRTFMLKSISRSLYLNLCAKEEEFSEISPYTSLFNLDLIFIFITKYYRHSSD